MKKDHFHMNSLPQRAINPIMKIHKFLTTLSLIIMMNSARGEGCRSNPKVSVQSTFPNLSGKLIYHSYEDYNDGTSQIFLFDFKSKKINRLSRKSWNISDPMNAQFSLSGNVITFMGIQNNAWNVFVWTIGSDQAPVNITTSTGDSTNEDPIFSKDGKNIFYKKDGVIVKRSIDLSGDKLIALGREELVISEDTEVSMPAPTSDGLVYYSKTKSTMGDGSDIFVYDLVNKKTTAIDVGENISAYYPIVDKNNNLFYARKTLRSGDADQIYMKELNAPLVELSLNDCDADNSDPSPVNNQYIIFSSNSESDKYELYLGDIRTGERWSLSSFGVNADQSKSKLGSHYFE